MKDTIYTGSTCAITHRRTVRRTEHHSGVLTLDMEREGSTLYRDAAAAAAAIHRFALWVGATGGAARLPRRMIMPWEVYLGFFEEPERSRRKAACLEAWGAAPEVVELEDGQVRPLWDVGTDPGSMVALLTSRPESG